MRKQLIVTATVLLIGVGLIGCDQFAIDEAEPAQSVDAEQAFSKISGFEAAVTDLYDNLQSFTRYGQYYMLYPDALADNADADAGANRYPSVVDNVPFTHLTDYGQPYSAINLANNIIVEIDEFERPAAEEPVPQDTRDRIKGQALALRALNYFDLVRTKAYEPGQEVDGFDDGVILRTEPTRSAEEADFRPRSTNEEVYDRIISDLESAAGLLDGLGLPDARMNEAATEALLARVHLYEGNWQNAEVLADSALAANSELGIARMVSESGYQAAWIAPNHPECLFELKMTQGQDGAATNTNESLASLSYAPAAGEGTFNFQVFPTQDWIDTLPSDDIRRSILNTAIPVLGKYNNSVAPNTDNIPMIRMSEVYLILAEARAESAGSVTQGAVDALNMVRTNRGLDAVDPSDYTDVDDFINDDQIGVYVERRRELNYEGHRFFDLKRRGKDIPKPQSSTQTLDYDDDFRILAPLPQAEVRSNPELEQNPGY